VRAQGFDPDVKASGLPADLDGRIAHIRDVMRQVLRRGVSSGELRPDLDVELSLLMLNGPSMMQNMFQWNTAVPEEGFQEALVDAFLR